MENKKVYNAFFFFSQNLSPENHLIALSVRQHVCGWRVLFY